MTIKIVGIDPGIANVGWGMIEWTAKGVKYVDSGYIQTSSKRITQDRIATIVECLKRPVRAAQYVAIEAIPSQHWKRGLMDVMLCMGALNYWTWFEGHYLKGYMPTAIKASVTGSGGANKLRMIDAVADILGYRCNNSHEADGLAVALTHWKEVMLNPEIYKRAA